MAFVRRFTAAPDTAPTTPTSVRQDALALIDDRDEGQRRRAARQLGAFPDTADVLCNRLPHESCPEVREAILTSLMLHNNDDAVRGLVPLLAEEDAGLRNAVVEALREMPVAIRPYIAPLLADPRADVRLFALELFQARHHPYAPDLLLDLLSRETHVNVLSAAIDRLSELGTPYDVPALRDVARRFPGEPYLEFAANAAIDRINARHCLR